MKSFMDATNEKPWLWVVVVVAVLIPVILLYVFCFSQGKVSITCDPPLGYVPF